jgi:hypothetical protein
MTRNALRLFAIAALAACASTSSPDRPNDHLGASTTEGGSRIDTLSVRLNQSSFADGGRLEIRFDARVADSRCPANVVCVWAGDAHVRIATRVAGGAFVTADLHSALNPQKVVVDRYTITMVGMTPYPGTGQDDTSPVLIVRVSRD